MDADQQIEWLDSMGLPVDELALEFDDGRLLIGQFKELRWVPPDLEVVARPLDSLLAEMSGEHNAALWTEDGLRLAPEWAQVRGLARDVLFTL
jgi:hypothetical protein